MEELKKESKLSQSSWQLFLLFLGLKLANFIQWEWTYVFTPFLIYALLESVKYVLSSLMVKKINPLDTQQIEFLQKFYSEQADQAKRYFKEQEILRAQELEDASKEETNTATVKPKSPMHNLKKALGEDIVK